MENILRAIFIAFIAVLGLLLNMNLSAQAQTLHYLKEDLEVAVHDATLELDKTELSKGRLVFNQEKALNTLRESFERNSKLSPEDYELVDIIYYDDSTVDSFPVTYTSSNGRFSDTFNAATIVAVIKGKKDVYFTKRNTGTFTQVSSYSYKINVRDSEPTRVIGTPNAQGFVWTVPYTRNTTSQFGMRTHPITNEQKLHAGMDIAAPGIENTPVVSAKAGKVTYAGPLGTYGNLVVINHGDGVETRYAHLAVINTANGSEVTAGQVIGLVGSTGGSTGAHLHLEVRVDGIPYNPVIFYP